MTLTLTCNLSWYSWYKWMEAIALPNSLMITLKRLLSFVVSLCLSASVALILLQCTRGVCFDRPPPKVKKWVQMGIKLYIDWTTVANTVVTWTRLHCTLFCVDGQNTYWLTAYETDLRHQFVFVEIAFQFLSDYILLEAQPRWNVYWPQPSMCLSVWPWPHSYTAAWTRM